MCVSCNHCHLGSRASPPIPFSRDRYLWACGALLYVFRASHSDDAEAKMTTLSRPPSTGSGVLKESKLKQPEVRPKILDKARTPASASAPSTTSASPLDAKSVANASEQPAKKVPPPPDKHSANAPRAFARAESKEPTTQSLHKVRSVQSLANEIRRIRSLRTDTDGSKAGGDDDEDDEKLKKPEKKARCVRS